MSQSRSHAGSCLCYQAHWRHSSSISCTTPSGCGLQALPPRRHNLAPRNPLHLLKRSKRKQVLNHKRPRLDRRVLKAGRVNGKAGRNDFIRQLSPFCFSCTYLSSIMSIYHKCVPGLDSYLYLFNAYLCRSILLVGMEANQWK